MDPGIFFQENVLSNFVVTDRIFGYLPKSDILNCSLVSKKWVSPSRQFLRCHHSCLLRLGLYEPEILVEALEMLNNSIEIMYSGIYLDMLFSQFGYRPSETTNSMKAQESVLRNIFDKIPIRVLISRCGTRLTTDREIIELLRFCLDLISVEEIEKLKIIGELDDNWKAVFPEGRKFLKLKVLDMEINSSRSVVQFLDDFPALQEWSHVVTSVELTYFVKAKKERLVKNLSFGYSIDPKALPYVQSAQLVLKRMEAYLDPKPEYARLVWHLLRTSISSLQEVEMRFGFYWPFIKLGISPLKNVKKLVVQKNDDKDNDDENYDWYEDMDEKIRQDANTRRIFPNATNIEYFEIEDWDEPADVWDPESD